MKFFKHSPAFPGRMLAAIALLGVAPLPAQVTIEYGDTENDATPYDTTAPNNPTTLRVATGAAIQSGVLSGTGSVIKTGAGALTLDVANTYTGGTLLQQGTLRLHDSNALGAGTVTIEGGTLGNSAADEAILLGNDFVATADFAIDAQGLSGAVEFFGTFSLGAAPTRTITLTAGGLACFGGAISGQSLSLLTSAGASQAMFCDDQSNTFTGTLRIGGGVTIELAKVNDAVAVSGNLLVDAGGEVAVLIENQFAANASSSAAVNGTLRLAASGTNAIDALTGSGNVVGDGFAAPDTLAVNSGAFDGTLTETSGNNLALHKLSVGILTLTGANTFTGATVIDAGTLVVNGSLAAGSAITINNGATLGGSGTVGALALSAGGTISPGASSGFLTTGTLTTGAQSWSGGGRYLWQINDATGAKGAAFDWLNIGGALTLGGSPGIPVTIAVVSLTLDDLAGPAANFDPANDASWILATSSGIIGFDPGNFLIDASAFANAVGPNSSWSLFQNGNDLVLAYQAVPEPSTLAAIGMAGLLAILRPRRRSA